MATAWRQGQYRRVAEHLVTEEPLEIRVAGLGQDGVGMGVTMRTPGHDFELAVGFLWSEGIITSPDQVRTVRYCELPTGVEQDYNVVTVGLDQPLALAGPRRLSVMSASCGICGTASIEALSQSCPALAPGPVVAASTLVGMPDTLLASQVVFTRTGGLHAAGLFDPDGQLLAAREDVGRHNAVDKLIGRAVLDRRLPWADSVLVVSGRVSFEIVQKAALTGIGVLAAVSAPSGLATATADELGMTLVGFVRPGRANVYTHSQRVDLDA